MSSILTNSSATVALQTLKSINNDLNKVQSEISTGMSVSSAKDNASVFAISKVMADIPEQTISKVQSFADALKATEETAVSAMSGNTDNAALVQAIAQTELAVETVVSVRDKVVQAYQEILRMPI